MDLYESTKALILYINGIAYYPNDLIAIRLDDNDKKLIAGMPEDHHYYICGPQEAETEMLYDTLTKFRELIQDPRSPD